MRLINITGKRKCHLITREMARCVTVFFINGKIRDKEVENEAVIIISRWNNFENKIINNSPRIL